MEIDPAPMWRELLHDLDEDLPPGAIALRFHRGLARALAETAVRLATLDGGPKRYDTVALTGGCFQNSLLLEEVAPRLRGAGFSVLLTPKSPPATADWRWARRRSAPRASSIKRDN